ncbi:hypothetical protein [Sphingomonas bacterium]|uniref:hypothetical protein n=1 Tax=Sphingomonas bacterium TaxID=1895847 RepID=UPI002601C752|nr:hypothetical protein [Sphingomonas bacterium]MDB5677814.1 hypothetical protein [Sphingomonas bacterium]
MTSRAVWRLCALAGLIAFVISWSFGRIPGLAACGPVVGGGGPIFAFELARTAADIAALFGADPCRSTLVAAQYTGLWLDGLGFIPSYTAFLVLAAIAASRGWMRRATVAMLIVAALSDEVEGFMLGGILKTLPGTQAQLDQLYWAVHIKFGLLALATTLIGLAMVRLRGLAPLLLGGMVWIGGMAAIYGFGELPGPVMMRAFTLAWFALLAAAIIFSFAPSLFSARDAQRRGQAPPTV